MSAPRSPLRVGVLLDPPPLPAWAARVVEAIRDDESLDLAFAVTLDPGTPPRSPVGLIAYEALDRRLFGRAPNALERTDASASLDGVPQLSSSSARWKATGAYLSDEDVAAVREASLDVLVDLGTSTPRGPILATARLGMWSPRVGDPERFPGAPALFWELYLGELTSAIVLEVRSDEPAGGSLIDRSAVATNSISLQRNRNVAYWKAADLVVRRLTDLSAGRWSPHPEPLERARPPRAKPTLRHIARLTGRLGPRAVHLISRKEQWILGLRRHSPGTLPQDDPSPWTVVRPPVDRYWADPFVLDWDGEPLVFVEQVTAAHGKGELMVGRLGDDGRLGDLEPILPADHHQSYPYVFRDSGRAFMVPESAEAGRVELWTATDFPLAWEPVCSLLEGVAAVDASVLHHRGLYWMWVSIGSPGRRPDDEVFLYVSERLDSGWAPHPRNPVVCDARSARPAGRPFEHEGKLVRPAQDCTGRYGAQVVFNVVDVLTPEDYSERPIGTLTPAWGEGAVELIGAHTYSFDAGWEATDGLRLISRWPRRS